jgi:hypothetical protein
MLGGYWNLVILPVCHQIANEIKKVTLGLRLQNDPEDTNRFDE